MNIELSKFGSASPPSVLAQHWEELQGLWQIRCAAIMDQEYVASDIKALDARIEAHVDGLLVGGKASIPLLLDGLKGEEEAVVVAVYVLLRFDDEEAADLVVIALREAKPDQLKAFCQSLCQSRLHLISDRLVEMYEHGPTLLAATVAEVFAYHGRLSENASRLKKFYEDEDIEVRRAAWRITALVGTEDKS